MDRYARSWMFFLQTLVCTSERTPHTPPLMLQVAGLGYAELLRKPIRRSSEVRYAPARWDTTAAGSAVILKRASVSYIRADHEVLCSVHKKLIIPLTSRITLTLSLTKQALRLAVLVGTRQPTRKKRYEFLIVMMTATVLLSGACGGSRRAS